MSKNLFRVKLYGRLCVYCGVPADAKDHWPPSTAGMCGFIFPACWECNGLAGTEWPFDLAKRCEHVKNALRVKHARVLRMPQWSRVEIQTLGATLRRDTKQMRAAKAMLERRLSWNSLEYLRSIGKHNYLRLNT